MVDCRNCKYCPPNYYDGEFHIESACQSVNICYCGNPKTTWGEAVCGIENKDNACSYYERIWWKFWR